ncbi:hypothetical protein GCM10011487_12530 [Steroidobacter agaridevorans]|uniref:Uncharacterized protein n=1 Tax=Steroidobacter agaridevorans TaxID=2695856 RepID=A0A829Y892_9GAMM|nr:MULTISPECIES: hypothetical protein [Steroidobacteraceae]GFE79253.1 hypothetical protein GCM10011487_12530 [Steroidobacter agaridevorans]
MADRRQKGTERQDRGGQDAPDKDVSNSTASAPNNSPDPTEVLASLIEAERTELMYVHSILRMLYDVLLYSDDDDGTMHADVARTCSMLIRESMERLEVLVRRYKAGEFHTSAGAQRPAEGA